MLHWLLWVSSGFTVNPTSRRFNSLCLTYQARTACPSLLTEDLQTEFRAEIPMSPSLVFQLQRRIWSFYIYSTSQDTVKDKRHEHFNNCSNFRVKVCLQSTNTCSSVRTLNHSCHICRCIHAIHIEPVRACAQTHTHTAEPQPVPTCSETHPNFYLKGRGLTTPLSQDSVWLAAAAETK